MKIILALFLSLLIFSCGKENNDKKSIENSDAAESTPIDSVSENNSFHNDSTFSNESFADVKVEKIGENIYKISGEARVFEATVSYVVEDGHTVLKKGFTTAKLGAPEWGNFNFIVEVEKIDPNLSLTLILFESSAKDGSPLHQLLIPLK